MKNKFSRPIVFVLMLALLASFVPCCINVSAATYADKLDGSTTYSADFLLDPGHGGSDPGACLGSRQEAKDVLDMAKRVGTLMEASGVTVAFTRTSMTRDNSLENLASIQKSGTYKYYVSFHRNAFNGSAKGIETYYYAGGDSRATKSASLANDVQNAFTALNIWVDRGVRTAGYYVLKYTTIPAILMEMGFIDNPADNTIFDNNFEAMAKAIAGALLKQVGKTLAPEGITAPKFKAAADTMPHNSSQTVSWEAVSGAESYNYTALYFEGELSAVGGHTITSGSTTSTSFSFNTPAIGRYVHFKVEAVKGSDKKMSTLTIMLGEALTYPEDVEYIPITSVNGNIWESNSTILTGTYGGTFTREWWRAFECSPNADGTYTVDKIYENGTTKSITVSGKTILFVMHAEYVNYFVAKKIVVGDKLTLKGIYLDNKIAKENAHLLVNGGTPTAPQDLTPKDSGINLEGDYAEGAEAGITGDALAAKFNESGDYIKIFDKSGKEVTSGKVGTGCTINLVVNGETKVSYTVVIGGDVDGDGQIASNDHIAVKAHFKHSSVLSGEFLKAADYSKDGKLTVSDYIKIKRKLTA